MQVDDITHEREQIARCRSLWAAKVMMMIRAAAGSGIQHDEQAAPRRARDWFERRGRDYVWTCLAAGIDPDALHEAYLREGPKAMAKRLGQLETSATRRRGKAA